MTAFPLHLLSDAVRLLPDEAAWARFLKGLPDPVRRALFHEWRWQTHGGQKPPKGKWRTWLLMAGRGFGKTRAGAEWVLGRIRATPRAQVALVGATIEEAAKVMVEGPSGLLALARPDETPEWRSTLGILRFPNGAEAQIYSGANADGLRGPEHHFAWCDELAKWKQAEAAWDNLQMGLRLGKRPRCVVTTTPRRGRILTRLRADPATVETGGRTDENAHVAEAFVAWAIDTYGGTRLGRQELDGVLFEDVAEALWTRKAIEKSRVAPLKAGDFLKRVVVGVDPPASAGGDACGIIVCGLGRDGLFYVVDDCSVSGERPEGWARAVARAADEWGADRIVAETNQGGEMVESVLRSADAWLPVRPVAATRSKSARAEPISTLFENGKAKLAGRFPELEDEMAGMTATEGYQGPGRSPDRADAMVWALSELTVTRGEPRIRRL
jgi:phage terminase large subunit-like protein